MDRLVLYVCMYASEKVSKKRMNTQNNWHAEWSVESNSLNEESSEGSSWQKQNEHPTHTNIHTILKYLVIYLLLWNNFVAQVTSLNYNIPSSFFQNKIKEEEEKNICDKLNSFRSPLRNLWTNRKVKLFYSLIALYTQTHTHSHLYILVYCWQKRKSFHTLLMPCKKWQTITVIKIEMVGTEER